MISLCSSSVRCQLFALNNFSSKTARQIFVSPAEQKRDICTAFPASSAAAAASAAA